MIIKIEDAPGIKHISIDINFEDNGEVVVKTNDTGTDTRQENKKPKSKLIDVPLDLDEKFDISAEVVTKPEIPEIVREVKVSDDMVNAQF